MLTGEPGLHFSPLRSLLDVGHSQNKKLRFQRWVDEAGLPLEGVQLGLLTLFGDTSGFPLAVVVSSCCSQRAQ